MNKKILVVDDNRLMLNFMVDLLEKEGHQVVTAEDGISALDILKSFVPDVIFVDLIMPKIDGERLCRIIRTKPRLKNCYIVILSGAVAELGFDHTQVGADRCIAKGPMPAMAEHVLATVEEAGSESDGDLSGEILGLDGVYPRQMTKELLTRNRYLETILGSIAEGILEIDSNRVIYTNAAAEFLFNKPQEEILNSYPPDLFSEKEYPRIEILLNQSKNGPSEIGNHNPVSLNNRLVAIKCLPISDDASSLMMLVTDVTRRKKMELELQHAHKMEAIGTIASGIAHNFRNTLASILTNSQVLQMMHQNDEKVIEVVQRINSSVKKGTQLVDGLLQFSRKQTRTESEVVDLCAVINELYQLIKESFKKINIRVNIPESLIIKGDSSNLSHALMNLCTNAYDAMPDGGDLTIDAKVQGDFAIVEISDTGSGMDQETIEKCFDPFFTQGDIGESTGLGLSTAYGIVKSHDGDIQVESQLDHGTIFRLMFPRIVPETEKISGEELEAGTKKDESELVRGKDKKVLVVDNEKDLVNALIKLLEFLGYQAESASNGMEAIEKYKGYNPDMVLMDINMPGMDGITCAEKIIEHDADAKIAIISGYEENYGIDESKRSLITGYLTKPISLKDLSTFLESHG